MPTENADPIRELFKAEFMASFKRALEIHDALAQAFLERTGKVLERDSPYTTGDLKRANRILRSEGAEKGSAVSRRLVTEILQLRIPKEGA